MGSANIQGFASFFGDDPQMLEAITSVSATRSFPKGCRIFGEGEPDLSVYYILSGTARALRYSSGGAEVVVDTFGPGSLIGEMAVLNSTSRTADLYAMTDTVAAVFPGAEFIRLLEQHGTLGLTLCRLLADRLRATTQKLFEQSTLPVAGRVAAELLRLAEPVAGSPSPRIEAMVSNTELSRRLGIARETVSRVINAFKDQGILEADASALLIVEPEALVSRLEP